MRRKPIYDYERVGDGAMPIETVSDNMVLGGLRRKSTSSLRRTPYVNGQVVLATDEWEAFASKYGGTAD